MKPYFADDTVRLYVGDCREILPALGERFDCAVADPSYEETSLRWDRWADGWPAAVASHTNSLWCFGSMRMFLRHHAEIEESGWKLSQDVIGVDVDGEPVYGDVTVVWEKHNGSGFAKDRFRRVHENILHWYRGEWRGVHHDVPRVPAVHKCGGPIYGSPQSQHTGAIKSMGYVNDGYRLLRSVVKTPSVHGKAIHPTEKPVDLLDPLIRYACPPGGVVLDPFAGSASTAVAARLSGRRAVLIEADERYAEKAAQRLQQTVLNLDVTA
jgi:site-specific DNA-methyltransferase (adenine-specific)